MELKEYQSAALEAFARWRDALETAQAESNEAVGALEEKGVNVPGEVRDYPRAAWEKLKQSGGVAKTASAYVGRKDGARRPIPHVCFKVPTGGGKTLLAAAALERLNRQTGLTIWITPTRAIYGQTKAALWDREHPYRQTLERASGGRVKLLEKDDRFTAADVANHLCVMLLMLPAASRRKDKEFLRMFRDSGRYPAFFPDGDDALGDGRLLRDHPDLERTAKGGPVKHSLFNVFKMLRPVVVLDEAHKAYGQKRKGANEDFVYAVNRLNPCLVIELSATPNRGISNLLVDITGVELKKEEMIKLPVQGDLLHQRRMAIHAGASPRGDGEAGRGGAVARPQRGPLHPPHRRGAGGAHRQEPARRRARPRRGRARAPRPEPRRPRRRRAREIRRERRAERREGPALRTIAGAVDHHQGGVDGGLGLLLRVSAGDAGQRAEPARHHPAGGAG